VLHPDEAAAISRQLHGGVLGACAICGREPGRARHNRDHDHKTGRFRGLLCWHCNRELLRRHTPDTLRACLAYLERAEGAQT